MAGERRLTFAASGSPGGERGRKCGNMKLLQQTEILIKSMSLSHYCHRLSQSPHTCTLARIFRLARPIGNTHVCSDGRRGSLHRSTSKKLAWRQVCVIEALSSQAATPMMAQQKQDQRCVATAGCVDVDVDDNNCSRGCAHKNAAVHITAM